MLIGAGGPEHRARDGGHLRPAAARRLGESRRSQRRKLLTVGVEQRRAVRDGLLGVPQDRLGLRLLAQFGGERPSRTSPLGIGGCIALYGATFPILLTISHLAAIFGGVYRLQRHHSRGAYPLLLLAYAHCNCVLVLLEVVSTVTHV